jgi:hypothetical protein
MSDPIKTRFEISADELQHRMELQEKYRNEPCRQGTAILEAAIDSVLEKLGVNTKDSATVAVQMNTLGIVMTENTDERAPQLNGFFIFVLGKNPGDLIPYAWIGAARINSQGECYCDIQHFLDNRLEETGGVKIIG